MGSTRFTMKRSLLLRAFLAVSLYSAASLAADSTTSANTADSSTTAASAQSAATQASSTTVADSSTTNTGMPNLSSSTASMTSTASESESLMTGLPTLTGTSSTSIPSYTVTIPPTQNAPYMNHSTLPDGTVFIAVGAILGAFAVAILAWRGIVACLLHRSVERAAMAQHVANDKAFAATTFPAPPAPFYKYTDRENSSPTLSTGAVPGRGVRRTNRGPTPSATLSQTNLFFSPTAGGGMNPAGSNRHSQYLPSGFYAASSASPTPGHGHGQSISLSNLRPSSSSRGGRDAGTIQSNSSAPLNGPSPPDSPSLNSRSGNTPVPRNHSTSSINLSNLNRPPSGRAPSAYLDDLLDDH